jgi:ParB family transcriptional regulator, chromosome partitioning protein
MRRIVLVGLSFVMALSYHIAVAEKKSKRNPLHKGARRRRKPVGASTGLAAGELQAAAPPGAVAELHWLIEADEGKVLSVYRDP